MWGQTGAKLYGSKSGADYVDNQKRFSLFCKAAIESLRALPCGPGESSVIVANDWHSALVPVLLKDVYQPRGEFLNTKVAFTVHNIAFQGRFWADSFPDLGLPASSLERFEFSDGFPQVFDELAPAGEVEDEVAAPPGVRFPKLNWLQAGITAADKLITVSPNYATEIASGPELGVELHHAVKAKGVEGIVNGIDVADWSPSTDKFLSFKYNAATVEAGKAYAKAALQVRVAAALPLAGCWGSLLAAIHDQIAELSAPRAHPPLLFRARRRRPACRWTPPPPCLASSGGWRSRRAWTSCWPPSPSCRRAPTCRSSCWAPARRRWRRL